MVMIVFCVRKGRLAWGTLRKLEIRMRKRTFTIGIHSRDAVVAEGKQQDLAQLRSGECRRDESKC